jgi:hypothetical protein
MKIRHFMAALGVVIIGGIAGPATARADTVMYDSAGFFQGAQSFTDAMDVPTAGTLTITLADISWFDTDTNLNIFLTTNSGPLGGNMGVGTESVNVEPGMVYAHWAGDPVGGYGVGAYGLQIDFTPAGAPEVPLPRSMILLLSGLGILFGWQRRNRTVDAVRVESMGRDDAAMTT